MKFKNFFFSFFSFWLDIGQTTNNYLNMLWTVLVGRCDHPTRFSQFLLQLESYLHGHIVSNHCLHICVAVRIPRLFHKRKSTNNKHCTIYSWIADSPRWLLLHGRVEEAQKILVQSAKCNDRMHLVPNNLEQLLQQQAHQIQNEPPPAGWWSLWKGEKAVRHMVCVHLCWSIYIVVYYGMLLNIRAFSRDHLEINTVIAGTCLINNIAKTDFVLSMFYRSFGNYWRSHWALSNSVHYPKMVIFRNIQHSCRCICLFGLGHSTY